MKASNYGVAAAPIIIRWRKWEIGLALLGVPSLLRQPDNPTTPTLPNNHFHRTAPRHRTPPRVPTLLLLAHIRLLSRAAPSTSPAAGPRSLQPLLGVFQHRAQPSNRLPESTTSAHNWSRWASETSKRYAPKLRYRFAPSSATSRSTAAWASRQNATRGRLRLPTHSSSSPQTILCTF